LEGLHQIYPLLKKIAWRSSYRSGSTARNQKRPGAKTMTVLTELFPLAGLARPLGMILSVGLVGMKR
jgi:hypothetical protein